MCIGGVRESDAPRLERAVGDGVEVSEDVEDWELDFDTDGQIEGSVCRISLRPRREAGGAPLRFRTDWIISGNGDASAPPVASVSSGVGEGGRGIETGNARDILILILERDEERKCVMLVVAIV